MKRLIKTNNLSKANLLVDESLFSIANGFLGVRGNFSEGYGKAECINASFINGFYDSKEYSYEENLPGFPQKGETIVNIIDGQKIEFIINDSPLNMETSEVIKLERYFDIEKGFTFRNIHFKTDYGFEFIITEKRVVSFHIKELFTVSLSIKSVNYNGKITVKSYLNLPKIGTALSIDPRAVQKSTKNLEVTDIGVSDDIGFIIAKTLNSNLSILSSMCHDIDMKYTKTSTEITAVKEFVLQENNSFNIVKKVVFTASNHHKDLVKDNKKIVKHISKTTFDELLKKQEEYLIDFWKDSLVEVYGNDQLDTIINYSIYQLNSSGGTNPNFNIPAKGLSGDGYEGHYFWDTEIYMLPFFTLTNKEKAKSLLLNRYMCLKSAKAEALALGQKTGVKIPWRTITGKEVSPYYPAGAAQYHINSDVAYAFIKYYEVTGDVEFMIDYGFEVLLETARTLYEIGNYANGLFHINSVTGPDEYTTCVDDNYYTNSLAKYHFEYVYNFYNGNKNKLNSFNVSLEELNQLKEASEKMNLIYDKQLNIFAQDKTFLEKKRWDIEGTPSEKFPLLLNYHPLMIYRHQVLKQADVLLSMFLLDFDDDSILRNSFDYYKDITTHDSSLSKCVYSILASKTGNLELAYDYLLDVCNIDINNTHQNTAHGLHIANMGGSYMAIVHGFGGLRISNDGLKLAPVVPEGIDGYTFSVLYKGATIKVIVKDKIYLKTNKQVKVKVYNELIEFDKEVELILN